MPHDRDRLDGLLTSWNDERGFGFVRPADGSANLFVHISEFGAMVGRPEVGDIISYRRGTSKDGRLQALDVHGPGRRSAQPRRAGAGSLLAILVFVVAYLFIDMKYSIPVGVAAFYGVASILTFMFYAYDKRQAKSGGWRVSETTLLLLGLVGGWPGAILGQLVLRHKTVKASFRSAFWGTVVLNLIVFVAVTTPFLRDLLNR